MTKKKKIIIAILAVLLLLAGIFYAQKSTGKYRVLSDSDFLSAEEKVYGLSVIWETAKTYYGMWDQVPELDWDAEYQAAIARVLEANSLYAYYNELSAFTALLRDGHTQLGCLDKDFQTALRTGRGFWVSPISLRYMEDAFILCAAPRSTLAKIPLGSTVTEINGLPTGEYLEQEYGLYVGCFTHGRREEKLAEKMLLREDAKELAVSGLTPDGAAFNVTLSYAEYAGKREQLPDDLSMDGGSYCRQHRQGLHIQRRDPLRPALSAGLRGRRLRLRLGHRRSAAGSGASHRPRSPSGKNKAQTETVRGILWITICRSSRQKI